MENVCPRLQRPKAEAVIQGERTDEVNLTVLEPNGLSPAGPLVPPGYLGWQDGSAGKADEVGLAAKADDLIPEPTQ